MILRFSIMVTLLRVGVFSFRNVFKTASSSAIAERPRCRVG